MWRVEPAHIEDLCHWHSVLWSICYIGERVACYFCLLRCEIVSIPASSSLASLPTLARIDDWLTRRDLFLSISASDQVKIPSSTSIGLKSASYSDVLFHPVTAHVEISAASEWCELPKMHLGKLASFACTRNFNKCCSEADWVRECVTGYVTCWASSYRGFMSLTFCSSINMLHWWKACILLCLLTCKIVSITASSSSLPMLARIDDWLAGRDLFLYILTWIGYMWMMRASQDALGSSHHSHVAEIWTSAVIGLNKTSEYDADFNPMDVLEGILTLSEAEMYRIKSRLVSQSSILAHVGSDDNDDDAVMETISHVRRQSNMKAFHHC